MKNNPSSPEEVKKHFCSPKIEILCFSAFLLSDLYGFINRKKLYVAQNQEHSPSENDENAAGCRIAYFGNLFYFAESAVNANVFEISGGRRPVHYSARNYQYFARKKLYVALVRTHDALAFDVQNYFFRIVRVHRENFHSVVGNRYIKRFFAHFLLRTPELYHFAPLLVNREKIALYGQKIDFLQIKYTSEENKSQLRRIQKTPAKNTIADVFNVILFSLRLNQRMPLSLISFSTSVPLNFSVTSFSSNFSFIVSFILVMGCLSSA